MPLYDMKCSSCGHEGTKQIRLSELDSVDSKTCPLCGTSTFERQISASKIVSGVNMAAKVPGGFNEVLSKIKEAHPRNSIKGDFV